MNGQDVVNEARTLLDTPFHHQARLAGIGADCIGIILLVGQNLGLTDFNVTGYGKIPSAAQMQAGLKEQCDRVAISDMQDGDILLFTFDKEPQHLGFKTDIGILHSYQKVGKCVEHSFDSVWKKRLVSVHRFKGLT